MVIFHFEEVGDWNQARHKYIARTCITLLKGGDGRGSLSIIDS